MMFKGTGCKEQKYDMGKFDSADKCAVEAATRKCTTFMWSQSYPSWGCRCCTSTARHPDNNPNWNVYSFKNQSAPYSLTAGWTCGVGFTPLTSSWQSCENAAKFLGYSGDSVAHVSYPVSS